MFLSDWYSEKQQKRIKEAEAEGLAKGTAKYYAAVKDWNDRRIEAESKGETFDEPMPTPQNIQEATPLNKLMITMLLMIKLQEAQKRRFNILV